MRPSSLAVLTAALLGAGALAGSDLFAERASSSSLEQPHSPFLPSPPFSPPREILVFGHVRSLVRTGRSYELRVDPAEYLSGETANRAAIADGVIQPGDVVPNDHYVREEGHRLLTFRVPAHAHVTVVAKGIRTLSIPVSELGQIVRGKNPRHRPLMEPENGFWIRVATDTVRSLDQQYSP